VNLTLLYIECLDCHSCGSRNPEVLDIAGLPPEFTPYLIRGRSDKLIITEESIIV
jgi:hypothetical protein